MGTAALSSSPSHLALALNAAYAHHLALEQTAPVCGFHWVEPVLFT